MRRSGWVVATKDGFLGLRRYDYGRGTTAHKGTPFEHARIFLRKQDAAQYESEGKVMPVIISLAREA